MIALGDAQASLLQGIAPPAAARPPVRVRSARSRNRAEAWAYDLARQRDYALAMARSQEERAEVQAAYEADRAAGPDFTRYHKGSRFAALVPEHQLDRTDRHKIMVAFTSFGRACCSTAKVARRRPVAPGAPSDATRRGMQALEDDLLKVGADEASIGAALRAYRGGPRPGGGRAAGRRVAAGHGQAGGGAVPRLRLGARRHPSLRHALQGGVSRR